MNQLQNPDTFGISSWFLKALQEAPHLEKVNVDTDVFSQERSSYADLRIQLPKLREIALCLATMQEITLFDHLDIPSATQISISCLGVESLSSNHLSVLHRLLSWSKLPHMLRVALKLDPKSFCVDLTHPSLYSLQILHIYLAMRGNSAIPMSNSQLCSLLPFERITQLDLTTTNAPTIATVLLEILPLFSHLQIFWCSSDTFHFLTALSTPFHGAMPNPHLHTLRLTASHHPPSPHSLDDLLVLKEVLRERMSHGVPIKEVTLPSRDNPPDDLREELKAYSSIMFK